MVKPDSKKISSYSFALLGIDAKILIVTCFFFLPSSHISSAFFGCGLVNALAGLSFYSSMSSSSKALSSDTWLRLSHPHPPAPLSPFIAVVPEY
jgi:hypothetical protein